MKVVLLAIVLCTTSCVGQFVDEMQVYEKECLGEDVFPCMSGGCIQQSQYCDGKVDCDDGTDENYCRRRAYGPPDGEWLPSHMDFSNAMGRDKPLPILETLTLTNNIYIKH